MRKIMRIVSDVLVDVMLPALMVATFFLLILKLVTLLP